MSDYHKGPCYICEELVCIPDNAHIESLKYVRCDKHKEDLK